MVKVLEISLKSAHLTKNYHVNIGIFQMFSPIHEQDKNASYNHFMV
jgi:hypothetical protein